MLGGILWSRQKTSSLKPVVQDSINPYSTEIHLTDCEPQNCDFFNHAACLKFTVFVLHVKPCALKLILVSCKFKK